MMPTRFAVKGLSVWVALMMGAIVSPAGALSAPEVTPPKARFFPGLFPEKFESKGKYGLFIFQYDLDVNGAIIPNTVKVRRKDGPKGLFMEARRVFYSTFFRPAIENGLPVTARDRMAAVYFNGYAYGKKTPGRVTVFDHDRASQILVDNQSLKSLAAVIPDGPASVARLPIVKEQKKRKWGPDVTAAFEFSVDARGRVSAVKALDSGTGLDAKAFGKIYKKALAKTIFAPRVEAGKAMPGGVWRVLYHGRWWPKFATFTVASHFVPATDWDGLASRVKGALAGERLYSAQSTSFVSQGMNAMLNSIIGTPSDFPPVSEETTLVFNVPLSAEGQTNMDAMTVYYERGHEAIRQALKDYAASFDFNAFSIDNQMVSSSSGVITLKAVLGDDGQPKISLLDEAKTMDMLRTAAPVVHQTLLDTMADSVIDGAAFATPVVYAAPRFPRRAIVNQLNGEVEMLAWVDDAGRVIPSTITLKEAVGGDIFVEPSRDALTFFQFRPLEIDGQRVMYGPVGFRFMYQAFRQ